MSFAKVVEAVAQPLTQPAPPATNYGIPTVTEIKDPSSFEAQKLVHVELLQPGLQVFATPQLAEQQTQLVAEHLASPSVVEQIAPFFSSIPVLGSAFKAAQYFEGGDAPPAIAQLTQNIERAREGIRAISSTGSATPQAISGRASQVLQAISGGESPASLVAMRVAEMLGQFSGSQASAILESRFRRSGGLRGAMFGRRRRRRVVQTWSWGQLVQ